MGYLCPVCAEPFESGAALANHLAVTAILHGEDHEACLEREFADWASLPRAELAEAVRDMAAPTDDDHGHPGGDHRTVDGVETEAAGVAAELASLDAEGKAVLREAQALTQAMRATSERSRTQPANENETNSQPDSDNEANAEST